jgi:hypothetical protein
MSNKLNITFPISVVGASPVINTPWDTIPDFGANPTTVSKADGPWSDPTIWTNGVPEAGDIVSIRNDVQYDAVSNQLLTCVAVQSGGRMAFRPNKFTFLHLQTWLNVFGGIIELGTPAAPIQYDPTSTHFLGAEIVFADVAPTDAQQWATGLICLGKFTACGMAKPSFLRLAADPLKGQTTTILQLAQPATGWNFGDVVLIPDTRQLGNSERWGLYSSQDEIALITAISADKMSLTVQKITSVVPDPGQGPDGSMGSHPVLVPSLAFDHVGAFNPDDSRFRYCHVGNLTRSAIIRSASHLGTRGHACFTYRAELDASYIGWHGLGRTTNAVMDANNVAGRHPLYLRHLMGPAVPRASGYQFEIKGCAIFDNDVPKSTRRWAVPLTDTCDGLIQGNVLYNWAGAGIITDDYAVCRNLFDANFICGIRGDHSGRDNSPNSRGLDGSGIWMSSLRNKVTGNVAASCVGTTQEAVAGVGFKYFIQPDNAQAAVSISAHPGADTSIPAQCQVVNMKLDAIAQCEGNETYGGCATGITAWQIGTDGYTIFPNQPVSTIKNFTAWHCWEEGFWGYPTNNLVLDGYTVRGDMKYFTDQDNGAFGLTWGDYRCANTLLINADIQGVRRGFAGTTDTPGTLIIQDSFFECGVSAIDVTNQTSPGARATIRDRAVTIKNVRYGSRTPTTIYRAWVNTGETPTPVDTCQVIDHNGVAGDNFSVYLLNAPPPYVAPAGAAPRAGIVGLIAMDNVFIT